MRVYSAEGVIYIPARNLMLHTYSTLPEKGRVLLVSFNSMYMTKNYKYVIPSLLAILTVYVHARNSVLLGVNINLEEALNKLKLVKISQDEYMWLSYFISTRCILASSVMLNEVENQGMRYEKLKLIMNKLNNKEIQEFICTGDEMLEVLNEIDKAVKEVTAQ